MNEQPEPDPRFAMLITDQKDIRCRLLWLERKTVELLRAMIIAISAISGWVANSIITATTRRTKS